MTMAETGQVQPTGDAGSVAPIQPAAGNVATSPQQIPAELMPTVEKLFDQRLGKILTAKEKEWSEKQDQARKAAEMTELEREKARAGEAEKRAHEIESRLTQYERREAVRSASATYVPDAYIATELSAVNGEFDAAEVAKRAREKFEADVARGGLSAAPAPAAGPSKPQAPRTGGTPSIPGQPDFSTMTPEEAREHAVSLGPGKGQAWWLAEIEPWRRRGGRFKGE